MIEKVAPRVVKRLSKKYNLPEEEVWKICFEVIEELKASA